MATTHTPVLSITNYYTLIFSILLLLAGLGIMTLDTKPYGFGFLGITLGPIIVVMGLLLPVFSIFPIRLHYIFKYPANSFSRLNNLLGWLVFAISLTVYIITLEPTASFWDCGEFISAAYKLQVPHPPGAPFFLLIGRLFSFLALGDVTRVANFINMVSAVASALTILFLFWSIILLGKRIISPDSAPGKQGQIILFSSGIIGALSFAFTDSFWFSAVEAEVYALSSLFTAMVVWAMLKWRETENPEKAYLWLLFIAYLMGLSIGVHLLNLLAIPAMAFIYFHRQYSFSYKGALITLAGSLVLIGFIMLGIIPGIPSLAGSFELFFINSIGLPFGSGIIIFLILFFGGIIFGLIYSHKTNRRWLQAIFLGLIYILIGYSSYLIIPIRSGYNPLLDENNPEDVLSFASYLNREQYEQRPLFYGPQFTAELIDQKPGKPKYTKIKDRYEIADQGIEPVYNAKNLRFLPRVYSNQPSHLAEYKKWIPLSENQTPTFAENLSFLFRYQLGHMYWRYFFWNFAGRESDIQQACVLWPWQTDQNFPPQIAQNKAHNNYFLLPFLLGCIGLIFHFRRNKPDAVVVILLFLITGVAIAFYLNQPPVEPRERDYAFTGSFYAFSIWIGLGVLALATGLKKISKNYSVTTLTAIIIGSIIPLTLFIQNYDDHDRSDRFYAADFARNLLQSCAPNAILFTNGDNDTFPLWYAQEVEGLRRDVRVIVLTYFNTDWYISQMKRPAYESAPLPISLEPENYQFSTNNYLPYVPKPQVQAGMDLTNFISLVKTNHPALQVSAQDGRQFLSLPTKKFTLPINKTAVLKSGIIPKERENQVVENMQWTMETDGLEKKQLIILDILATNNWQRPIYFSTTANSDDYSYLKPYLQLEGLAYRVLPAKNPDPESDGFIAKDIMYHNIMQKFAWRNLTDASIYYDDNYRNQMVPNYRHRFALLAEAYLLAGDKKKARKITEYCLQILPDAALPYDYFSPLFIPLLAKSGAPEKADKLATTMKTRATNMLDYYAGLNNKALFAREIQINLMILQQLFINAQNLNQRKEAAELEKLFMEYYGLFNG